MSLLTTAEADHRAQTLQPAFDELVSDIERTLRVIATDPSSFWRHMLIMHCNEKSWPRPTLDEQRLVNDVLFRATEDGCDVATSMTSFFDVGDVSPAARLLAAYWVQQGRIQIKPRTMPALPEPSDITDPTGWLSPEGDHHPCAWSQHDSYAREQLGRSVANLEADGWCRITRMHGGAQEAFAPGRGPTEAQAQWLLEHLYGADQ